MSTNVEKCDTCQDLCVCDEDSTDTNPMSCSSNDLISCTCASISYEESSCTGTEVHEVRHFEDKPFITNQCLNVSDVQGEIQNEELLLLDVDEKPVEKQTYSLTATDSSPEMSIQSANRNIPFLKDFLQLPIPEEIFEKMVFGETLMISFVKDNASICLENDLDFDNKRYEALGGFCVNIENQGIDIGVFITSQFSCNGKIGKSSIYGICEHDFTLIEEKKTEMLMIENAETEKSIHVINDDGKFIAIKTEDTNKQIVKDRGEIEINVTGNLIPDGLGFILMRYLVITGYVGYIEAWSIHINGHLCRSLYNFEEPSNMCVCGTITKVVKVTRCVASLYRNLEEIELYYLQTGHLIRHSSLNCDLVIHINPFSPIPPNGLILDIHETWRNDIELMSNYLDVKEQKLSEMKDYLKNKSEVKCLVKDYLLLLLHTKPSDILNFTLEFFLELSGDMKQDEVDEDAEDDDMAEKYDDEDAYYLDIDDDIFN